MKHWTYHLVFRNGEWALMSGPRLMRAWLLKAEAAPGSRAIANNAWRLFGVPCQLLIHNKNGRIAKEASYGCDSPRRPG